MIILIKEIFFYIHFKFVVKEDKYLRKMVCYIQKHLTIVQTLFPRKQCLDTSTIKISVTKNKIAILQQLI